MDTLRIIRIKEVMERTGLGRSSIYNMVNEGRFPKPVKLGARASGWDLRKVNQWIEDKLSEQE